MQHSVRQTLLFAVAVCFVCSIAVSAVSVGLHERQVENQLLDKQKNVLEVAGLMEKGERLSRAEIQRRFAEGLEPLVVDLETGTYVEGVDPLSFDQRKASRDPDQSRPAPENPARVRRIPKYGLVFQVRGDDGVGGIILPIEGMGGTPRCLCGQIRPVP